MPSPTVTLLMTRSPSAAERFLRQLPAEVLHRVVPVLAPLLQFEKKDGAIDLSRYEGVIFTSANGVRAASELSQNRALPAYCVGEVTAQTARDLNWSAEVSGATANELVATLIQSQIRGPLLHLCGQHTRGRVAERLSDAGCPTSRHAVYDQKLLRIEDNILAVLQSSDAVIAPVFSPRTARQFVSQCPNIAQLHLVAMSSAVAEPLSGMMYSTLTVAERPDAASMAAIVEMLVHRLCRVESGGGAQ